PRSLGYPIPGHKASQPCGACGSRARAIVIRAAAQATIPAGRAIQGPSHGRVNAGGRSVLRVAPTVTVAPSRLSTIATGWRGRMRSPRIISQTTRPSPAPIAARTDHCAVRPQAPNGCEPSPNRVHGRSVAPTATTKASPTIAHGTVHRSVVGSTSVGRPGPRAASRHSTPRTRPRTGTAQARQRGRPQLSQRATEMLAGGGARRSPLLVLFSSSGTGQILALEVGRSWLTRRDGGRARADPERRQRTDSPVVRGVNRRVRERRRACGGE